MGFSGAANHSSLITSAVVLDCDWSVPCARSWCGGCGRRADQLRCSRDTIINPLQEQKPFIHQLIIIIITIIIIIITTVRSDGSVHL
ncbi:unnamed protein product [Leuciscus chuanchicus]